MLSFWGACQKINFALPVHLKMLLYHFGPCLTGLWKGSVGYLNTTTGVLIPLVRFLSSQIQFACKQWMFSNVFCNVGTPSIAKLLCTGCPLYLTIFRYILYVSNALHCLIQCRDSLYSQAVVHWSVTIYHQTYCLYWTLGKLRQKGSSPLIQVHFVVI